MSSESAGFYDTADRDKRGTDKRRGNFTERPASGWMHEDLGLAAGGGIFYSFNVHYLGSIVVPRSLSSLTVGQQTECTRALIGQVVDAVTGNRRPNRSISRELTGYLDGYVTVANAPASVNISSDGLVIGPVNSTSPDAVIEVSRMNTISMAAGGEGAHYDLISYIAKDDTGHRQSYVFDCGLDSDQVLTTMGQAFVLAQQRLARRGGGGAGGSKDPVNYGYYDPPAEAVNKVLMAAGSNPVEYETAAAYIEVGGNPDYEMADQTYIDVAGSGGGGGGEDAYISVNPQYDTADSYLTVERKKHQADGVVNGMAYMDIEGSGGGPDSYMDVRRTGPAGGDKAYDMVSALMKEVEAPLPEEIYQNPNKMQIVSTLNKHAAIKDALKKAAIKNQVSGAGAGAQHPDAAEGESLYGEQAQKGHWAYIDISSLKRGKVQDLKSEGSYASPR